MTELPDSATAADYLVVGDPIAHSRSPEIHTAFAAQFGERIRYARALVSPGQLAAFADAFAARGGRGMNVTVPLKKEAYDYAGCPSELAVAQAVNTLVFKADRAPQGHNTDGIGLLRDLQQRHQVTLNGQSILLLGAGGAASGVITSLLDSQPRRLVVANRTLLTAQSLVRRQVSSQALVACDLHTLAAFNDRRFDLIINATSMGLSGGAAPLPAEFVENAFCYDMSYGHAAVFAQWASRHRARATVDGLGMLVEQAAESFFLWRGLRPQTEPVLAALRVATRGSK